MLIGSHVSMSGKEMLLNSAREAASYKYMKLQDEPVTTKDYNSAQEKWNKERAESNKKAQEELADHVK